MALANALSRLNKCHRSNTWARRGTCPGRSRPSTDGRFICFSPTNFARRCHLQRKQLALVTHLTRSRGWRPAEHVGVVSLEAGQPHRYQRPFVRRDRPSPRSAKNPCVGFFSSPCNREGFGSTVYLGLPRSTRPAGHTRPPPRPRPPASRWSAGTAGVLAPASIWCCSINGNSPMGQRSDRNNFVLMALGVHGRLHRE